jgi:hypothetical protein
MTQRKFNQFTNLCHLLAYATNIVITNFIKVRLLILTLDGVALYLSSECGEYTHRKSLTCEDDGVLCNYTIFCRVCLHNFKFHCTHATADEESVAFADRSVS